MKKIVTFVVALCLVALVSCSSKEESAIKDLNRLVEKVEANSANYTLEDWDAVSQEYEVINNKMAECNFNAEQTREVGRLNGRMTAALAKQGASILEQAAGQIEEFSKGFLEGLGDSGESEE